LCNDNKADWKNLDLNFEGTRSYIVTTDNYLVDITDDKSRNFCIVSLFGNTRVPTEYILGDVFMQNMYVVLDYENSRFGINGNYRTVEPRGDKPDRPSDEGSISVWIIIGIFIGAFVIVGAGGLLIARMRNKKLQANLQKYETL
jgi:hypothetical protein